jgi:fido (protein-threonine AMPylation protein)
MKERFSHAEQPSLISDEMERARLEAENALRQTDAADFELQKWLSSPDRRLRVSDILRLHRVLMTGLTEYAGNFRPAHVKIEGSSHVPPLAEDVPALVEDMCDYLSNQWASATSLHLAAYVLWRLNWIHPFVDGNGRTARTISNLILSAHSKRIIPGDLTIPEQIVRNKEPYYKALEPADKAFLKGKVDVSVMEDLLGNYLANQLYDYYKLMTGKSTNELENQQIEAVLEEAKNQGAKDRQAIASIPVKQRSSLLEWIERHPSFIALIVGLLAALIAFITWFWPR